MKPIEVVRLVGFVLMCSTLPAFNLGFVDVDSSSGKRQKRFYFVVYFGHLSFLFCFRVPV